MRKITDFIVRKRNIIIVLFIFFAIESVFLSRKVKINYDMAEYLPSDSETRIGIDIMEEEFEEEKESNINVMFKDLTEEDKINVYEKLSNIDGVSKVNYKKNDEEYNHNEYTLYIVDIDDTEDSELATTVYKKVDKGFKDYEIYMSGSVAERNKVILPTWLIVTSVSICTVILIAMCESYIEPFLFLACIGIAVLLNNGTNIILGTISHITSSIAPILQLALSMDYSIMLINRYREEKAKNSNKVEAMKEALYNAFKSISSSSITTVVGLLALVFMSFTIGRDLGIVLAKGVLFSLISIFFVLPSLILTFDKIIQKTQKRSLDINLKILGSYSYKMRPISIFVFIALFVVSFCLKGNLGILYTNSEEDEVSKVFPQNNQMAIIYKTDDEEKVASLLDNIENNDKVKEVLGYGNTINKPLTYDKLNEKLNDLEADVNIEDYLLKILYYNYYNQSENNKMTFKEFVDFIQKEVYLNDKMGDEIDENMKNNIDRLSKFTTENSINKLRTSSQIAEILEIDKKDVDNVLIYYNSKNNSLKLTVKEFIDFINTQVLTDSEYVSEVDKSSQDDLNKLAKYTNAETNDTKMSSVDMANLFNMDAVSMDNLYKYYMSLNDITVRMTLSEFANFVLNDILNNPQYASSFDETTINSIKTISTFSNPEIINKQMTPSELSNIFGLDENMIKQILLLKYTTIDNGKTMSITEFINSTIMLKNSTNYLDNANLSGLETLAVFAKNENNINTTNMSKTALANIFNTIRPGFVENIYLFAGLSDEYQMSPQQFTNLVITQLGSENEDAEDGSVFVLDSDTLNKLKLLKLVIDDSVSINKTKHTASQIASILGINENEVIQIMGLIDFSQNNIILWTCSPNEFVNLILSNMSKPAISSNINNETSSNLILLSNIINSSLSNNNYNYTEIATFLGIEEEKVKSIYTLYQVNHSNIQLSPNEFVDFVLTQKNDNTLSGSLSQDKVSDLQLVKSVMDGVKVGQKYSSVELSNLLGINIKKVELLYGLYVSKNINPNQTVSLNTIVSFLLNDVIKNPDYSDKFDVVKIEKLKAVNGIMNSTFKNTKYTKEEIFTILTVLTDSLDKKMIDLLYVYYGSDKEYNEGWTMTIQDFVNFLNENILNDSRFDDFIDDEMRQNIINSKDTIKDAKKLLIGNNYSRIVLNSKFELESEETFEFIQMVKNVFGENIEEFYIIGDSPMAYEMSQSFNSELDFITVLTMIAIFVVVAITFKSFIIPLILVLTIQEAVYMTMGILALSGGTVYFISILIVQSILMGATIDYAILYTSYYLELREKLDIRESLRNAYNKSIHTILTSSSILIISTFLIGRYASAIAAKICKTISEGVICSTILILLLLPATLSLFDRFIIKNKK